jgi:hypothetical protein
LQNGSELRAPGTRLKGTGNQKNSENQLFSTDESAGVQNILISSEEP